jgi:hypothetical protein
MREEMDSNNQWPRGVLIAVMILFAAVMRIVPHPWNFAPIGAMALFSGAVIRNRALAFVFPLLAMAAGDVYVGWHHLLLIVYGSFLVSVAIGFWLRDNLTVLRLGGAVLLGAVQFFLITNFAVWAFMEGYPRYQKTLTGLATCYLAGMPYFWNTLAGDAMYSVLLFAALYLAERAHPALQPSTSHLA